MGFCAKVYRTHIEISPYAKDDIPKLEKKWSIYEKPEFRYVPIAYYIEGTTLYIPRGMDLYTLGKMIGTTPAIIDGWTEIRKMQHDYAMKFLPRDKEQVQSINFLTCENQFEKNKTCSQFALNLSTSFGKTYCAINSMLKLGVVTIIITHSKDIRSQWKKEILKFTTIYEDQILEIAELSQLDDVYKSKISPSHDVYLVTHSMLTGFASSYENGWVRIGAIFDNLGIGLKIVDEVHLRFHTTLMIDFFTNVWRSVYLTATHGRSDDREERLFVNAFANTLRFGKEFKMRKHVNYRFVFFNSNPSSAEQRGIRTSRGISSYLYSDYAFRKDEYHTLELVLYKTLDQCLTIEGRTLILTAKIEDMDYLLEQVRKRYPNIPSGVINSHTGEKEAKDVKENARIIISSIKSLGTGSDILKLRNLILTEPFSSKITASQVIGRLREYSKEDETYVYELVNKGFHRILKQIEKRIDVISEKCLTVTQSNV